MVLRTRAPGPLKLLHVLDFFLFVFLTECCGQPFFPAELCSLPLPLSLSLVLGGNLNGMNTPPFSFYVRVAFHAQNL